MKVWCVSDRLDGQTAPWVSSCRVLSVWRVHLCWRRQVRPWWWDKHMCTLESFLFPVLQEGTVTEMSQSPSVNTSNNKLPPAAGFNKWAFISPVSSFLSFPNHQGLSTRSWEGSWPSASQPTSSTETRLLRPKWRRSAAWHASTTRSSSKTCSLRRVGSHVTSTIKFRWTQDVFIYSETAVCSISVNCLQTDAKKEEISHLSLIYFTPQLALSGNMKNEVEPLNQNISNRTGARLFSFYCSPVVPSRTQPRRHEMSVHTDCQVGFSVKCEKSRRAVNLCSNHQLISCDSVNSDETQPSTVSSSARTAPWILTNLTVIMFYLFITTMTASWVTFYFSLTSVCLCSPTLQ